MSSIASQRLGYIAYIVRYFFWFTCCCHLKSAKQSAWMRQWQTATAAMCSPTDFWETFIFGNFANLCHFLYLLLDTLYGIALRKNLRLTANDCPELNFKCTTWTWRGFGFILSRCIKSKTIEISAPKLFHSNSTVLFYCRVFDKFLSHSFIIDIVI